jgi:hypothetical protein
MIQELPDGLLFSTGPFISFSSSKTVLVAPVMTDLKRSMTTGIGGQGFQLVKELTLNNCLGKGDRRRLGIMSESGFIPGHHGSFLIGMIYRHGYGVRV